MSDILDNELVKKYFNDGYAFNSEEHQRKIMSERVLRAMQEPIRKGELFVHIHSETGNISQPRDNEEWLEPFHPHILRLPDRFQAGKECDHCDNRFGWHTTCCKCGQAKPQPSAEVKCEYNTPGCKIEQGIIHTRGCKPSQPGRCGCKCFCQCGRK